VVSKINWHRTGQEWRTAVLWGGGEKKGTLREKKGQSRNHDVQNVISNRCDREGHGTRPIGGRKGWLGKCSSRKEGLVKPGELGGGGQNMRKKKRGGVIHKYT